MEVSKDDILHVLDQYVHVREDREILTKYLTDKPRSYEVLAEECEVSRAKVYRTIKKYLFIYKYLPGEELNTK